ncbi:MAG: hypothetical protein CL693_21465 [Cellvibrionaceae bacterium]|nr:hypothetical protein [Cellvibrionaceae bacterium]
MNTLTGTLLITLALLSPVVWSHNDTHHDNHRYENRYEDRHYVEHYTAKRKKQHAKKQKRHHRYYAHSYQAGQLSRHNRHNRDHHGENVYLTIKPIGFNRSRHHFHGFNICYNVH